MAVLLIDHTYYVGTGMVLAHNMPECDIGGVLVQLGKLKVLDDGYLKKLGIDAHLAKELITGFNKKNARFDLTMEKKSKRIFLKAKDGTLIDTTYTLDMLKVDAPLL